MKRISILAIIVLLLFTVEFFTEIIGRWNISFVESNIVDKTMVEIQKPDDSYYYSRANMKINVYPLANNSIDVGEAYNSISQNNTPFIPSTLVVGCWLPLWFQIVMAISGLAIIPFMIWGVVCFIKLLLSVRKEQIFTRANAKRLRIFVYAAYGSVALIQIFEWFSYRIACNQLVIDNFGFSDYKWLTSWSDVFLMVLIVEIFAKGVKLQEEQELTI